MIIEVNDKSTTEKMKKAGFVTVEKDADMDEKEFKKVLQELREKIRSNSAPLMSQFRYDNKEAADIKAIYYNDTPGKETVVVIWNDGVKVIKKLAEGDNFDLNVGVALCIADRLYGSKTAFHKMVKTKLPKTDK